MKRFLLALPLLLVVGLLFVELPVGNSSPNNDAPVTATPTPQSTPTIESIVPAPSKTQKIAPAKPSKTKIDIGGKKANHSNDDDVNEDEEFGEDDD